MAIICPEYKLLFIMVPGTGCSAIGSVLRDQFGGQYLPSDNIFQENEKLLDRKHNSISQLLEHGIISHAEVKAYVKFGTIRNPFDRFVTEYARLTGTWIEGYMNKKDPNSWFNTGPSAYLDELKRSTTKKIEQARNMEFNEWVLMKLGLYQPNNPLAQSKRILRGIFKKPVSRHKNLFPLVDDVDYLIHYERLEQDFNTVLKKVGVDEFVPLRRSMRSGINATERTANKKPYKDYYQLKARNFIEKEYSRELASFGYSFDGLSKSVTNILCLNNAQVIAGN